VGLRDRSFGGENALRATLASLGAPLREDAEVLADPSLWLVKSRVGALVLEGNLRVVVGSAAEVTALRGGRDGYRHLFADGGPGLSTLITGFPSTGFHAIHPLPTFGYGGAVALGQRLLDALYGGSVG
jgi:hypothetical protein